MSRVPGLGAEKMSRFAAGPLGIGQNNLVGQGLHKLHEPGVAGGGLDDHLERPELAADATMSAVWLQGMVLRARTFRVSSMTQTVIDFL